MLSKIVIGTTTQRGTKNTYMSERNPDAISYSRASVELHGKMYVGSAGIQAATEFSPDPSAQQTPVELTPGIDYDEVHFFRAGYNQLGGDSDALLSQIAALQPGTLVRVFIEEIRQPGDKTIVTRENVVGLEVLRSPGGGTRRK